MARPRRRIRPLLKSPRWLAPGALVIVAVVQMLMARQVELNPWTGGGFGMFSTVDHLQTRQLRVFAPDGRTIEVPDDLFGRAAAVRAFPTPSRMRAFADLVADVEKAPVLVELVRMRFEVHQESFVVERLAVEWGEPR
ncbi:MAG: hypothetical protein ACI9OJ_004550 [Myxococcota bacterium]|jgi:hypothetical protein